MKHEMKHEIFHDIADKFKRFIFNKLEFKLKKYRLSFFKNQQSIFYFLKKNSLF